MSDHSAQEAVIDKLIEQYRLACIETERRQHEVSIAPLAGAAWNAIQVVDAHVAAYNHETQIRQRIKAMMLAAML